MNFEPSDRAMAIAFLLSAVKTLSLDTELHKEAQEFLPSLSSKDIESITIKGGTTALRLLGVSNTELLEATLRIIKT